jgi:hypothetical protein
MQKTKLQKFFRALAWILGVLLFLVLALFTRVDRTDFREMEYYSKTLNILDTLSLPSSQGENWLTGWSKVNSTPESPVNLVGYKPRGKYDFVQDSTFIRTLTISNGHNTVVFLNYELMIIHPVLYNRIKEAIKRNYPQIDFVYFTATHTHSGMGGYMPGLAGSLAFGGYDEDIMRLMEKRSLLGIRESLSSLDTTTLFYQVANTQNLVGNRLKVDDPVDPFIRKLILEKKNGEKGIFLSYAAHSTIHDSKFKGLSGDYPHYLMDKLEQGDYDFSMFAAGTVGSHRPLAGGKTIEHVKTYADSLYLQMGKGIKVSDKINEHQISFTNFPLHLRKPHYRIAKNVRLRPYIFNSLFGETNAHFDVMLLGDLLLISSSGEISGVFMQAWEKYAQEQGLYLIISCFNGGYIGYITPDEYYDGPYYEARDMNWFGPYNGAYFDEIVRKIIDKASN